MANPVKYRQYGVEMIERFPEMSRRDFLVFNELVKSAHVKDNCVQHKVMTLAKRSGLAPETVTRVITKLSKWNVLKKGVTDIFEKERIMLNPRMVWSTVRGDEFHYACNMYDLGSHFEAYDVSKLGESLNGKIDAATGELYSEYQHRLGELDEIIKMRSEEVYGA